MRNIIVLFLFLGKTSFASTPTFYCHYERIELGIPRTDKKIEYKKVESVKSCFEEVCQLAAKEETINTYYYLDLKQKVGSNWLDTRVMHSRAYLDKTCINNLNYKKNYKELIISANAYDRIWSYRSYKANLLKFSSYQREFTHGYRDEFSCSVVSSYLNDDAINSYFWRARSNVSKMFEACESCLEKLNFKLHEIVSNDPNTVLALKYSSHNIDTDNESCAFPFEVIH